MKSYTLSWALLAQTFVVFFSISTPNAWGFTDAVGDRADPAAPSVLIRANRMTSEETARNAGIVGRHSRRYSEVDINPDVLLDSTGSNDGRPVRVRVHSTVELEPFPGERYVARGMYVEQWNDPVWSWAGSIDGYDNAEIVLTFTERSVYGVLRVGPIVYEIQSGRDGRVYVRDPDLAAYGIESACAFGVTKSGSGAERLLPELPGDHDEEEPLMSHVESMQSDPVIDLVLFYTPAAKIRYDIEALANNAVASMNISFTNSGVNATVRIVHYAEVAYTEANPMNVSDVTDVTIAMASGTGDFSDVPGIRHDHSADLAILIWDGSEMGDTCGAAYIVGSSGDDAKFTGNTGGECIALFNNFAHELGHNLGGHHDYPDGVNLAAFDYSHGHAHLSPDFRTIMSSANSCSVAGCDRINRWSDPDSQHLGEDLGVENESEMVKSNNQMADVIADYRTPTGSAPGTIGTVTVTRLLCFGNNLVDWTTPSGLVGWYEVQTSTNSGFSSPQLVYRGSGEAIALSVGTETWVRVRACNGVGCSGWTNGDQTATFTQGCM